MAGCDPGQFWKDYFPRCSYNAFTEVLCIKSTKQRELILTHCCILWLSNESFSVVYLVKIHGHKISVTTFYKLNQTTMWNILLERLWNLKRSWTKLVLKQTCVTFLNLALFLNANSKPCCPSWLIHGLLSSENTTKSTI